MVIVANSSMTRWQLYKETLGRSILALGSKTRLMTWSRSNLVCCCLEDWSQKAKKELAKGPEMYFQALLCHAVVRKSIEDCAVRMCCTAVLSTCFTAEAVAAGDSVR